jgi:DsbC/DsbD-like thiol-disulfide interchange protein
MPIMLRLHSLQDKNRSSQNKNGSSPRFTPFCVAVQPARKQKRSMTLSRRLKRQVFVALSAALALPAGAGAADLVTQSPWSVSENSQARLLAAGGPEPGFVVSYRAGIEIELKPGAHTYWREPGDAGVPPKVSFEGSRNLKSATLRFPAPTRIDEGGLQVFGYTKPVILPIEAIPMNAAEPVHLEVRFSYAACAKICIPAEAKAALDLAPRDARGADAGRLLLAAVSLPDRVENGGPITVAARPVSGRDKPTWRITIERPRGPWRDLFVEAPEGWFFETKRERDGFEVTAAEQPPGAAAPSVTLTLTGPRDYEVKIDLPRS